MHRQLIIVVLVAAGAQGCSGDGDGKTNPCETEACSGHGECSVTTDGQAICQCDPGYRAVGRTCVADCFAVDCGGLGGCVVVQNEPVCVCDQGYEGVGLDCRPAPETCHGISCSGHGGCVDIDGRPACICETGYAPIGLGCVPVSCTNVDCSGHGACVVRDGSPSCQCDPGYMAVGLGCVSDECRADACSGHGACALVDGEMECTCDHGYVAVDDECRPAPCELEDCSSHGACVEGREGLECVCDPGYVAVGLSCRPRCSGVDCGGHGVCVQDRLHAACLCDAGYEAAGERCLPEGRSGDSSVDGLPDRPDVDGGHLSVVRARFSSYREIEVMLGRAVHESSVSVDNMRILPDAPRHMRVTQATLVDESRLVLSLSQNHLPRAYQLIITDLQGVDSEPLGQLDLELVGEGSRVIFMSRAQGNGLLGSWGEPSMGLLAFLDDICQQEALAAGLVGTFTAWLSHGGTDMKCRVLGLQGSWVEPWGARCGEPSLTIDAGPWIGLDGFPIAHSFDELWGCRTLVPVRYHADGSLVMEPYSAWTGSDGQGREDGWCCADWTSTTDDGMVSNARAVCLGGAFVSDCINEARLVCGQVDPGGLADPVVDERFSKVVFVSSAVGTGDFSSWSQSGGETGLAAGDAICRNVAAAAGLGNPENFVVWASDSANDAYCRVLGFSGLKSNRCGQATLPTGGGPWTRPDGVLVAASVDDIVGGTLFSAPNLDETGTPTNNARVYTGSSSRGYGVASRCADWSDSSAGSTGAVGLAYVTYSFFSYFVDGNRCDSERPIYCFER